MRQRKQEGDGGSPESYPRFIAPFVSSAANLTPPTHPPKRIGNINKSYCHDNNIFFTANYQVFFSFPRQWRTLSGTCCGSSARDEIADAAAAAAAASAAASPTPTCVERQPPAFPAPPAAAAAPLATAADASDDKKTPSPSNSKKNGADVAEADAPGVADGAAAGDATAATAPAAINVNPLDSSVGLSVHQPLFPPGRIIHLVRHYPSPPPPAANADTGDTTSK